MNYHYLLGSMGMVDSTPDLLVDETHCCCSPTWLILESQAIIPQMSSVPANLARHATIQGLKYLNLSIILGIILNFLEEEINLRSEHVHLLGGVHSPLA